MRMISFSLAFDFARMSLTYYFKEFKLEATSFVGSAFLGLDYNRYLTVFCLFGEKVGVLT